MRISIACVALLMCCCAGARADVSIPARAPGGAPEEIPAKLFKPDGAGPFPAVVVMHDCSGLGPLSSGAPERWAQVLLARGYVVLLPDSFSTRGHPRGVCTDASPGRNEVGPRQRAQDARAALAWLQRQSYVDGAHVGIMGGSHGGSTVLATMRAREGEAAEPRFAAAVALYPGCVARPGADPGLYKPEAPLLILIGEKDDWTPAEPCRKLAETASKAGYPVAIKIYPGAYHAFDSDAPVRYIAARVNMNAPGGRGATTGGNAQAWADAIGEITAFFARRLARAN